MSQLCESLYLPSFLRFGPKSIIKLEDLGCREHNLSDNLVETRLQIQ